MTIDWRVHSAPITTSDLVRSRELDDDLVVYHSGTDHVSHFDPIARAVWEQLLLAPTFSELVQALTMAFHASVERVSTDVAVLLDEMLTAQLIQTTVPTRASDDAISPES